MTLLKKSLSVLTVTALLGLTACNATTGGGGPSKQTFGALGGAVLGGLAGSQFGDGRGQLIATGVGTLLGTLAGSEIGKSLDRADMLAMQNAFTSAHAAPVGRQIAWNNPQSGNSGSITPIRDGYADSGQYCREYEQTITIAGQPQTAVGTACQNADGTWAIVN